MAAHGESKPDIILNSPVGSKPAVYKWPLTYVSKGQKIDGAEEIIETIRWVAREYPEFKPAIENLFSEQPDFKSYDCIKSVCDKYNKITDFVMKMNKGTSVALRTSSTASRGLLKHIIQQVYNYAVVEPTDLNKYSAFSSETYGETSFEFMAQLIDKNQFKPGEQDTFVDLGSGVGHLVLQMAATVKCKKCYGIEIADVPAGYAKLMEQRFKFWMNWHGKTYTEFELLKGDFFDKQYVDIIKNSTHILVNNFAFNPNVDHKLKVRFLDLKDGTQILSSKPFCSPKSRVTERNLTDIGSIMHVVEIQPDLKKDSVSWTTKPIPYYLHILDGSRVEKYYERQKRRAGRPSKRRKTGRGSDSLSDDSEDNTVYGPTTRKAWSEWCNATNVVASNRTSTDSGKTSSSRNNSTDTENLNEDTAEYEPTVAPAKEPEPLKREKRSESSASDRGIALSQETAAQAKINLNSGPGAKSCLDKKRDYAIKKGGSNAIQDAPPSTLYSISKPTETTNGASSSNKIPNIVIKFKPEAKVVEGDSDHNSSRLPAEVKETEPKVVEENGKNLRQRKKSVTVTATGESQVASDSKAATKTDTKTSSQTSMLRSSSNSRVKKAPATAKGTSRSTNASKKKATSPEKNSSLDFLHVKTVESVTATSHHSKPAPGCENYNLGSIVETPSLPRVVIKDPSMYASTLRESKIIDKLTHDLKGDIEKFTIRVQHPDAKKDFLRAIEIEQKKRADLIKYRDGLQKEVNYLEDRKLGAMKTHCDKLGIKNTAKDIVNAIASDLKRFEELIAYKTQLEATLQLSQRTMNPPAAHSNSNQPLVSPFRSSEPAATLDLSIKQST